MSDGLSAPVLVLNRTFQPVRITNARQAFVMLYMGRAQALDASFEAFDFHQWAKRPPSNVDDPVDETIGTTAGLIRVPRLVVLTSHVRTMRPKARLSRRGVFLRDAYTCQYCGQAPAVRDLNLDHVMPKSRGGGATWENLVTSCRPCNLRKGHSTPEECGMPLRRKPTRPRWNAVVELELSPRHYLEWEPFLDVASY